MKPLIRYKLVSLGLIILALTSVGLAHADHHKTDVSAAMSPAPAQTCDDTNKLREGCRAFIDGFLQGALLTDEAIIKAIDVQTDEPSFSERAFKTRLGKRGNPPTELAGFCIPAERTLTSVVDAILDNVADSLANSTQLARNVYATLKTDYPCQ